MSATVPQDPMGLILHATIPIAIDGHRTSRRRNTGYDGRRTAGIRHHSTQERHW